VKGFLQADGDNYAETDKEFMQKTKDKKYKLLKTAPS